MRLRLIPRSTFGILVASLSITLAAAYYSYNALNQRVYDRFQIQVTEASQAVQYRMLVYEQILRGGVGLHYSSETVTRQEWAAYAHHLRVAHNWPGLQGFGWAIWLQPEELAAHEASVQAEGFPDYRVYPEGTREAYTSIIYLEPFDWRNQRAFGYDMWSNEVRREAMSRARDTGKTAASGQIILVQETEEDIQNGFLIYLPVYENPPLNRTVEERQGSLIGWVYSPFRVDDLMEGIISMDAVADHLSWRIYDETISEENLLYTNYDEPPQNSLVEYVELDIYGHTWVIEFRSGSQFPAPVDRAQPIIIAVLGVVVNVLIILLMLGMTTARFQAEELVEKKTRSLRQANAQLTNSNQALEQFAYVASHDLQEPLRTISSFIGVLEEDHTDKFDDEAREYFGYITTSTARMRQMVLDILQYSRVTTKGKPMVRVSLKPLLEELHNMFPQFKIEGEFPFVVGDRIQLSQLFQNLISNGLKYNESDEPVVVVRLLGTQPGKVLLAVDDNGIGIDPEYRSTVFDMFKRLHSTEEYPGTGIGLAVVRRIIDRHHGVISVEDAPEGGTRIQFTLPTLESDF